MSEVEGEFLIRERGAPLELAIDFMVTGEAVEDVICGERVIWEGILRDGLAQLREAVRQAEKKPRRGEYRLQLVWREWPRDH